MPIQGLSENEARARHQQGQGNAIGLSTSRSYWQIVWHNLFTFVNITLIAIGVALVVLGSPADAITTAGLVVLNVSVGLVQEARAKRKLDQIALLTRPTVTVIRDGQRRQLDPAEVVLSDMLVLEAGDQLVCDGEIVQANQVELDESLLTGESDYVPKHKGDMVYSGSYCVAGSAIYEATKVGADSTASKITAKARDFKLSLTPLQEDVNLIVRTVALISVSLGVLLYINAVRHDLPTVEWVQMAAVTIGMIPQGLIFLVTLAYALGAVRIARQGALVQRNNAIESMSNITVLCLDKTGTLTTNRIAFQELIPNGANEQELAQQLGTFAASISSHNRTSTAIRAAFDGEAKRVQGEVPFASSHKWSGLTLDSDGTYILGAPEVVCPTLEESAPPLATKLAEQAEQGLRVVLLAHQKQVVSLRNEDNQPKLPSHLKPLGLISLSDELRPDAHATLENFAAANIKLKIISGDNPRTVAALARQAGFDTSGGVLAGPALAAMDEEQFVRAAREGTVFGRITPDLKERLVENLQAAGEYVAMMGDGVNDVLSLKKANVGIAMQSGSTATRNVADIVLLNDSFAVLPMAFQEGQRIVNGILDTMRLLLSRTTYVAMLVASAAIIGLEFPFLPRQDALNSFVTAGLPPIILTIIARRGQPPPNLLYNVGRLVFPMALLTTIAGLGVYLLMLDDVAAARTALTLTVMLCGLLLIVFVKPPLSFLAITDPLSHDWRPLGTVFGLLAALVLIMVIAPLRDFFALEILAVEDYALISAVSLIWGLMLHSMLHKRVFERFFGIKAYSESQTPSKISP